MAGANFREGATPEVLLPRIPIPRTWVNKGKKKDRSVVAPILRAPPARCAPFLERPSSTSRPPLCKVDYHREFTYLLGGYLPVDSHPLFYDDALRLDRPPLFHGGALRLDRVLQSAYSRVPRPRRCRLH